MTAHILTYFGLINLVTLLASQLDKVCAAQKWRRVPERFLLTLSWIGGAAGAKVSEVISGQATHRSDYLVSLNLILVLHLGLASAVWAIQFTGAMSDGEGSVLTSWLSSEEEEEPALPRRFGPGGN